MPGIFGIISKSSYDNCHTQVEAMGRSMMYEPTYNCKILSFPDVGLFCGWTAIPGSFSDVYNSNAFDSNLLFVIAGECYPSPEAVQMIKSMGHNVDKMVGDWIIPLYRVLGENMFRELSGIFSGILLDRHNRSVRIFNDRFGIDRLYIHEDKESLYFSSEAKAILRVAPKTRKFDPLGLYQYATRECTFGTTTLFNGVSLLPAASTWLIENHKVARRTTYFSPCEWENQPSLSLSEFEESLRHLLLRIVPKYASSSSRVGISLTAGLDTRMIIASLTPDPERMICFTYSGDGVHPLDARLASKIARTVGLEHQILALGSDFFSRFSDFADKTVYITDGYSGVTGAHEVYLSRLARQLAPLRLTGNYGSEILRGVTTFKSSSLDIPLFNQECELMRLSLTDSDLFHDWHRITFAAFAETPWNLFGNLAAGRSQIAFRTPFLDKEFVKLAYRGPSSKKQSLALCCSIVTRVNESLSRIPTDKGYLGTARFPLSVVRQFMARAAFKLDYINNEGFPAALAPFETAFQCSMSRLGLLGLHKHLHYRSWFKTKLADYVSDRLTSIEGNRSSLWNYVAIRKIALSHKSHNHVPVRLLNKLLTIESIERQLFNHNRT